MPYITSSGTSVPAGPDAYTPNAQFKDWGDDEAPWNYYTTRPTTTDRDNIATPELREGLLCYVEADNIVYLWDGSAWAPLDRTVGAILSRNATVFSVPNSTSAQVTNTYLDTTKAVGVTVSGGAVTIITPGDYWVGGQAQFALNATGFRQLQINRNSLTAATNLLVQDISTPSSTGPVTVGTHRLVTLAAGDVVRMFVAQNSGGSLAIENAANTLAATFFEVVWAGA